jgi:hypothetical protein
LPKPLELDDLREVLRERLGALYPTSTGPSTGGQAQAAAVVAASAPQAWDPTPIEATVLTRLDSAIRAGQTPNPDAPRPSPLARSFSSPLEAGSSPHSEAKGWDVQEPRSLDETAEVPVPSALPRVGWSGEPVKPALGDKARVPTGSLPTLRPPESVLSSSGVLAVTSEPSEDGGGVAEVEEVGGAQAPRGLDIPAPLDPRRAPLQGRLDVTPLPSILARLARARASGSLLLRRDPVKKIVYLDQGVPVSVKSNLLTECLGQLLARDGLIEPEACERSVEQAKAEGRLQGELLVEAGALDPVQLEPALERQFEEKLFDVFAWRQGLFRFRADDLPTGLPRARVGDPLALTLRGVRMTFPTDRILLDLAASMDRVPELHLSGAEREALQISQEELAWLDLMDGQRTLGALLAMAGHHETVTRLFYGLFCLGFLAVR